MLWIWLAAKEVLTKFLLDLVTSVYVTIVVFYKEYTKTAM